MRPIGLRGVRASLMHRAEGGSSRASRGPMHSVSAAVALGLTAAEILVFTHIKFR